ncbi:MAG: DUF4126 domain-containing protein [Chloroflexi bacterium HGW-Chloroflexi-7]|nr:MAG: DUF4126 domain-containing protein [Chloroflexi bacterium HGW-Chloroflexi-7]
MEIFNIFSAFGLSASAGLNAYIPLLVVALLAKYTDLIHLQEPWSALTSWWTIGVLIVLSIVEFLADKIPAVNHVNDVIQSFVRPTAGAIVFAATANQIGDVNPTLGLIAGLLVAGSVHTVKSLIVRPAVTAATGGVGNVPVSMAEDVASTAVSFLSVVVPVIAVCVVIILTTIVVTKLIFKKKKTQPEVKS